MRMDHRERPTSRSARDRDSSTGTGAEKARMRGYGRCFLRFFV